MISAEKTVTMITLLAAVAAITGAHPHGNSGRRSVSDLIHQMCHKHKASFQRMMVDEIFSPSLEDVKVFSGELVDHLCSSREQYEHVLSLFVYKLFDLDTDGSITSHERNAVTSKYRIRETAKDVLETEQQHKHNSDVKLRRALFKLFNFNPVNRHIHLWNGF